VIKSDARLFLEGSVVALAAVAGVVVLSLFLAWAVSDPKPPAITANVTDGTEATAQGWICTRAPDAGFVCQDAVPFVARVLEVYGAKQGCSL
jgi:hypothetical protein